MFGADHAMRGQQAVLDIGQHRVRPAEGRVARSSAIGTGDVSLMDDARLFGDAAKPLAAVANETFDDGRPLHARLQVVRGFRAGETKRLCSGVEAGTTVDTGQISYNLLNP